MEYSASAMKYSLWFVETRETARMFQERSAEDVRNTVIEEKEVFRDDYFEEHSPGLYEIETYQLRELLIRPRVSGQTRDRVRNELKP